MTRISSIYRQGPQDDPTGQIAERRLQEYRASVWHEHGVAVLDPEQIPNDFDRQHVINMAEKAYGKRKSR